MQRLSILAFGSLVLLPSCNLFQGFRAEGQQTKTVQHLPDTGLRVEARNGRIKVIGRSGGDQVRVLAKIRAYGNTQDEADARLAKVKVICERGPDQVLVVRAEFPEKRRGSEGVSFEVFTPGAKQTLLKTSNGAVTAQGLSGPLDISSSNGSIEVSDHRGNTVVTTSNGRVRVRDLAGSLQARSSNGSIQASLVDGQQGPLVLRTSNGSIRAVVGASFTGKVRLTTSNGRARIEDPAKRARRIVQNKRSAEAEFGSQGGESRLRSSNGSVTLQVRQ